ncbi:UNKNOWN [Stylonychia lemnae]|uniref:Uncharacterized protein n=1 Tax=Stylonychia lemnae TaxID=5949 RepID=A0A078AQU2_STYLE|nr:UNKNOWN [Stylonychia lemnae]|eukprot:CDW83268.1 UNKNOWN [Stylonychia lemnae]
MNSRNKGDYSGSRIKINQNQTFDHPSPYINIQHNTLSDHAHNQSTSSEMLDSSFRNNEQLNQSNSKRVIQSSIQQQQMNPLIKQTPMMPPIHSVNSSETNKSLIFSQPQAPVVISQLRNNNMMNTESTIHRVQESQINQGNNTQDQSDGFELKYKNFLLDSKQVFAIYRVLMNKCKDLTKLCPIFTSHNLNSDRVFKDCITFINLFTQQSQEYQNQALATFNANSDQANPIEKQNVRFDLINATQSNDELLKMLQGHQNLQGSRLRSTTSQKRNKLKVNQASSGISSRNENLAMTGSSNVLYGSSIQANVMNIKIKNHYNTQNPNNMTFNNPNI